MEIREIFDTREELKRIIDSIDLIFNHSFMDMAILIVDVDGVCQYANAIVLNFMEIKVGQNIKNTEYMASIVFKAMEKREVMKTIRKIPLADFDLHIDITAFPIVQQDRVIGGIGFGLNITEKIELKNSLINSERLSLVGEMAARVIHDIRNPLQIVKSTMQAIELSQMKSSLSEEKLIESLHLANTALNDVNDLLNDLLQFSTPKSFTAERINLEEFVKKQLAFYEYTLNKYHINLTIKINNNLEIPADQKLLRQALLNLIQNAIDVLKNFDGERVLEIWGEKESADEVTLTIYNTGPIIDRQIIAKIFDLFFSTKGKSGTGLGLAIAKEIIETNHCGKIWCESDEGIKGTCFIIKLPSYVTQFQTQILA